MVIDDSNDRLAADERRLHVVINPASGSRGSNDIYTTAVKPLIEQAQGRFRITEYYTAAEGDGERIGRDIIKKEQASASLKSQETIQIVCLGGDGTTHELLNGLVARGKDGSLSAPTVQLAIVPTGTANALYASLYAKQYGSEHVYHDRLRSLNALLSAKGDVIPLTLSAVTLDGLEAQGNDGQELRSPRIAHLITSHALHASILADSEALRAEHPGIERFKMAAAQNATKWIDATIELRAAQGGTVKLYNPSSQIFEDFQPQNDEVGTESVVHICGPILYFACVTTDRLEPAFVPAPYSGQVCERPELKRAADEVDIVIIRPLQGRSAQQAAQSDNASSPSERESFARTILQRVTSDMYQEGKHINLTYPVEGEEAEIRGKGLPVCEYYRCAGYRWKPDEKAAQRTCIDGTVVNALQTDVRAVRRDEGAGNVVICR